MKYQKGEVVTSTLTAVVIFISSFLAGAVVMDPGTAEQGPSTPYERLFND